jgi:dihydrofolate synthase/folylpolyglutamate synthase
MTYQQTLDYLFSQLPMYQRLGAAAYKDNLDNTEFLCKALGSPEKTFKSVHVAGTNGKGSVSHCIASILQTAGYKTGLYTSPHLKDFRERIKINGKKIPKSKVTQFVKLYKKPFESIQPSFFEYSFGMAVKYFADEKVDIAVVETGMGGRLDSTNVVNSLISVITNIGFDHMQFLGDTLEKIALEKAGIIKPHVPVIIGETQDCVSSVFQEIAHSRAAEITYADQVFKIKNARKSKGIHPEFQMDILKDGELSLPNLKFGLTGNYQLKNIITVLQVVEKLNNVGFPINSSSIRGGLKNVIKNTGLNGRWQILGREPLIICDTGHNEDGMREVVAQLNEISNERLHIVIGFVNDKKVDSIIQMLPKDAHYYFCKADIPRGLDQDKLMAMCIQTGLAGKSYSSVGKAFEAAKGLSNKNDLIFIGGSTFVVAEVLF